MHSAHKNVISSKVQRLHFIAMVQFRWWGFAEFHFAANNCHVRHWPNYRFLVIKFEPRAALIFLMASYIIRKSIRSHLRLGHHVYFFAFGWCVFWLSCVQSASCILYLLHIVCWTILFYFLNKCLLFRCIARWQIRVKTKMFTIRFLFRLDFVALILSFFSFFPYFFFLFYNAFWAYVNIIYICFDFIYVSSNIFFGNHIKNGWFFLSFSSFGRYQREQILLDKFVCFRCL